MLEADVLNDCLMELPPYGSFPMRGFRKVTEPVRPFYEPNAWIKHDGDMHRGAIGVICTTPTDPRQVFIPISGAGFEYDKARYLKTPNLDFRPGADGKASSHPLSKMKPIGTLLDDVLGDKPNDFEMDLLRGMSEGTYRQGDTLPRPQVA